MPFWQRTEGVRANNKRAVLVVYSKESPCLLRCTIALPKKSSVEPGAPTTARERRCILRDAVLLWQAIRRGAGGFPLAPCLYRCTSTSPKGNPCWGSDAPTTARLVGLPPRGGQYFLSKRKKVPKKARGTATPEAAHVAMRRGLRSAGALRAVLDLGSLRSPAWKKPFIAHF